VSQARVAELADVARAAITQWRKRHADFPAPFAGTGNRFLLADVIGWLDRRPISANSLAPDEAPGATYGDRVRRRWHSAKRLDADSRLPSLLALGPDVCGDAPSADYLYLLLCLGFLRLHDQDRWVRLTRHIPADGDPGQARQLLRRVVAAVDASLGYPDLLSGPDAPPTRLRPNAFESVRKVVALTTGLLPSDLGKLHAAYVREARVRSDSIYTPISVTRTMVALLAGHTVHGNVRVYDPYARFGELLAEFVRYYPDPPAVRAYAEHSHPAELRLAGMQLAAAGVPTELAVTPSPPPGGATFLLTNPPFGTQDEPAWLWLRRCVDSLADDGRAAILMPYGAGFASPARAYEIRRELVEQGAVLAVVALPAQMFPGTRIGVCIWLLQPPTGRAAPVQLVDARRLGCPADTQAPRMHTLDAADIATIAATVAASEHRPPFSVLADPDEIRAHGYSLHPPEFQDATLARISAEAACSELDALFAQLDPPPYTRGCDQGWPRHPLRVLCDISNGMPHKSLQPAISRAPTAAEAVPVVHPRHLRNRLIDAGDAPNADIDSLEQHRLHVGDVLCVRTGAMGQTAIVRDCESGWLPHPNLLRLRVKEPAELDPTYLLAYLAQPAVQARIRDRSVRSLTTSIKPDTIGAFEIPLPPLADQRRILGALQALDERAATIERRLAAVRAARTALGRHLTDGTIVLTQEETQ
jgi:type I restriction enzyme M protein